MIFNFLMFSDNGGVKVLYFLMLYHKVELVVFNFGCLLREVGGWGKIGIFLLM